MSEGKKGGAKEMPDLGAHPPIRRKIEALRVEFQVMLGTGFFGLVVVVLYWFWGHEPSGAIMLLATMLLGFLPGSYLMFWSKRMEPRAEDRPDGAYSQAMGPVGSFPDSSIWPFVLGTGAAFCAVSLVFGLWTLSIGLSMFASALVGVILESRRGGDV